MFQAILHSKVGKQFVDLKEGNSWREIYRDYENFLTAGVFGRLIYLPPMPLWEVLIGKDSATSVDKLPEKVGNLQEVKFWPKWNLRKTFSDKFNYKEPDVFLSFEDVDLIVEAKRSDISETQDPKQWAYEQVGYYMNIASEYGTTKQCFLLAIGEKWVRLCLFAYFAWLGVN